MRSDVTKLRSCSSCKRRNADSRRHTMYTYSIRPGRQGPCPYAAAIRIPLSYLMHD